MCFVTSYERTIIPWLLVVVALHIDHCDVCDVVVVIVDVEGSVRIDMTQHLDTNTCKYINKSL